MSEWVCSKNFLWVPIIPPDLSENKLAQSDTKERSIVLELLVSIKRVVDDVKTFKHIDGVQLLKISLKLLKSRQKSKAERHQKSIKTAMHKLD